MHDTITRIIGALICAGTLLVMTTASVFAAADDARLDRLPPEQRELAEYLNTFLDEMDEKTFARVREMNGELVFEDRAFSTEWSEHEVRVTRGEAMEKAGRLFLSRSKCGLTRLVRSQG